MEATGLRSQYLQVMLQSVRQLGQVKSTVTVVFTGFAIGKGRKKMDFGIRLPWNASFSVDFSLQSLSSLLEVGTVTSVTPGG